MNHGLHADRGIGAAHALLHHALVCGQQNVHEAFSGVLLGTSCEVCLPQDLVDEPRQRGHHISPRRIAMRIHSKQITQAITHEAAPQRPPYTARQL